MNYSLEKIITVAECDALLQLAGKTKNPWNAEGATWTNRSANELA